MSQRYRRFAYCLALVLVLDLGRSLHARHLVSSYAPVVRAPSPVPPIDADDSPGARLYQEHCARCHGPQGRGDGPVASWLRPHPRDLSRGIFKQRSVAAGLPPTLDDIRDSIRNGLSDTSMPAFGDLLRDDQIVLLAEHVRSLGPHAAWSPPEAALTLPEGTGNAEHGKVLFEEMGCPACHGRDGRGDGAAAAALKDIWGQPAAPRDLTAAWSYRGGSSLEAIYRRIALGIGGTPMPGYLEGSSPAAVLDVAAYVRSLARIPEWEGGPNSATPTHAGDPIQRGRYLVRTGMCASCHATQRDADGWSEELAGGTRLDLGAHGIVYASNLTSDLESGLGARRVEEIALAIQTGHTRLGRLNFLAMPWIFYGAWPAEDALAVGHYLRSLPAVRNFVPPPVRLGFLETVLRKLTYPWPTTVPPQTQYDMRNHGAAEPILQNLPSTLLWMQLALLGLGIVLLFRVPADADREGRRSSSVLVASVVCTVVASVALLVVYWYPALNALPARSMVDSFARLLPEPVGQGSREVPAEVLQRGRSLYLSTSCVYCHNANGAGGGRIDSASGSLWAANLTPHASGLAGIDDASFLRVLDSGITRTGRVINPAVMPWPSYSNLKREDRQAILAYLRALPPIDHRVPSPRPAPQSPPRTLTFWSLAAP